MKRRNALSLVASGVVALFGGLSTGSATAQDNPFEGKTITMVVNVPAGSGADIQGRMTARFMEKHLPGNPTIIVTNKPGGRGASAVNFVYESGEPDGTTLFFGGWNAPAVLANAPGIRYVPEEMGLVGSSGSNLAFVARLDAADSVKALADTQLLIGGRGANRAIEVLGNLALKTLGVDFRYIGGYAGFSKIQAAIKAGEVQGGHAGLPGYFKFFGPDSDIAWAPYYHPVFDENGDALPLGEDTFPEGTVSVIEAYQALHDGAMPEGKWWDAYKWHQSNILSATTVVLATPGTPEPTLELLQKAYQATSTDAEFLAEYKKLIGAPPVYNSTAASKAVFKNYRNAPDEVKATLDEISKI